MWNSDCQVWPVIDISSHCVHANYSSTQEKCLCPFTASQSITRNEYWSAKMCNTCYARAYRSASTCESIIIKFTAVDNTVYAEFHTTINTAFCRINKCMCPLSSMGSHEFFSLDFWVRAMNACHMFASSSSAAEQQQNLGACAARKVKSKYRVPKPRSPNTSKNATRPMGKPYRLWSPARGCVCGAKRTRKTGEELPPLHPR